MNEKDLKIENLEKRIVALEIQNATMRKDNADMKYVIKSIGDLAFANNDAIGTISDKFNEFLDRISKNNKNSKDKE